MMAAASLSCSATGWAGQNHGLLCWHSGHVSRPSRSNRHPAESARARMSASPSAAGLVWCEMHCASSHHTIGIRSWSPITARSAVLGPGALLSLAGTVPGTAGRVPDGAAGSVPVGTAGSVPAGTAGSVPDGTAGGVPADTAGAAIFRTGPPSPGAPSLAVPPLGRASLYPASLYPASLYPASLYPASLYPASLGPPSLPSSRNWAIQALIS